MRISDWSSDVCSSDLSLSARVTVSLPDWRRLSAPRFAFGSGRLGSGRFGASTGVKRRGAGAALLVGRSEEHTSELQSLMRISYAVFCLKNKKNNKTPTLTHTHTTSHPPSPPHPKPTIHHIPPPPT